MQVHYINLDRRTDRNETFLHINAGIAEFQRCTAVEGATQKLHGVILEIRSSLPALLLTR